MISKKHRYPSSELRYRYIPISRIYRYRQMLLRCLYKILKLLCFDIEIRVLRYWCFFLRSSLGCCSSCSVLDTDCGVHNAHCIVSQSLPVTHAPPGPPSAAAAKDALGAAAAPAAPGAAPAAAAEAALGRWSRHQLNAEACDSSS